MLLRNLKDKPHIIAITEINYKNNKSFNISELSLEGHNLYCNYLTQNNTRGVIIYIC